MCINGGACGWVDGSHRLPDACPPLAVSADDGIAGEPERKVDVIITKGRLL